MKKKKILLVALAAAVCLLLLRSLFPQKPSPREELYERLEQVERAVEQLEGGLEKKSVTEVIPITYTDGAGSSIIHYICKTTYYGAPPEEGLNRKALAGVVDPEKADESRACQVNGGEAVLYTVGERAYLCWTAAPEYTYVLEYSPEKVPEEDIFRMAESIPRGQDSTS